MADSRTLLRHLKAHLREQGITYRELAKRLKLSEPTVKRDLSRGQFSV
ncbi:MAG: winged helix-turn-helix transcriptional regulator, partial [Steroidobacteraceae bacterium]